MQSKLTELHTKPFQKKRVIYDMGVGKFSRNGDGRRQKRTPNLRDPTMVPLGPPPSRFPSSRPLFPAFGPLALRPTLPWLCDGGGMADVPPESPSCPGLQSLVTTSDTPRRELQSFVLCDHLTRIGCRLSFCLVNQLCIRSVFCYGLKFLNSERGDYVGVALVWEFTSLANRDEGFVS